jgi:RND family efflux transporter MFP subunit
MKRYHLIALAAALALTGCRKDDHPAASAQPDNLPVATVRVAVVESRTGAATEEAIGTVRPRLHAAIEAKVNGRIEKMSVVPGQTVKSGEALAQLESREIQARLDQALAVRQQAEGDLKRFTALLAQQAVTQAEFDGVQARQRVAHAGVVEAETLLTHTRIVAPFDGVITRKLADVGDLATPGRALLEIEDPTSLRVEAGVPDAIIDRVRSGAKLAVRSSSGDKSTEAVVSEISPVADAATRTFLVKLDLPPDSGWRAGQFARMFIPVGETQTLRAPRSAVVTHGQMELVFVVTDKKARLRLIKTGKVLGTEVELLSGVGAGENVVIEGAAGLRDGQMVGIKP